MLIMNLTTDMDSKWIHNHGLQMDTQPWTPNGYTTMDSKWIHNNGLQMDTQPWSHHNNYPKNYHGVTIIII